MVWWQSVCGLFFWSAPIAFRRVAHCRRVIWALPVDQQGFEPPPAVCLHRQERCSTDWATGPADNPFVGSWCLRKSPSHVHGFRKWVRTGYLWLIGEYFRDRASVVETIWNHHQSSWALVRKSYASFLMATPYGNSTCASAAVPWNYIRILCRFLLALTRRWIPIVELNGQRSVVIAEFSFGGKYLGCH